MESIETITEYCSRSSLYNKLVEKLKQGWVVLYALPLPSILQNQQINYSSNSTTTFVDGSGQVHYLSSNSPPPQEEVIEVVLIRKKWDADPCPRCSYPFPNEDDIGRSE